MNNERQRDLEKEIAWRLTDLENEDGLESALTNGLYASVARKHRGKRLSAADRKLIHENYPQATDALIAERALDKDGLTWLVAMAAMFVQIGLDYSPLSHAAGFVARDEAATAAMRNLHAEIGQAVEKAIKAGLSPYGAMTIVAGGSVSRAIMVDQLPWPIVVRALNELIKAAMEGFGRNVSPEKAMENTIEMLAERMGISKAEARKYARRSEEIMGAGSVRGRRATAKGRDLP
jgi:hypothetical protein